MGKKIGKRFCRENLPEKLLKELLEPKNTQKTMVKEVLSKDLEGTGSLNEILVAIYRRFGKIEKRKNLRTTLFLLKKEKEISKVSKKGIYKLN